MITDRGLRRPGEGNELLGDFAGEMDKVMLLATWWAKLSLLHDILASGMGKPTYPINLRATSLAMRLWTEMHGLATDALQIYENSDKKPADRDTLAKAGREGAASDYGHPQGVARQTMAEALTVWYTKSLEEGKRNSNEQALEEKEDKKKIVKIEEKDVLFTVGGAGSIRATLQMINDRTPGGYIVMPVPHYTLHQSSDKRTRIHPVHLMNEPGYRLTRKALEKSLEKTKQVDWDIHDPNNPEGTIKVTVKEARKLAAFLFCDPNNPLGTVTTKEEWLDIIELLKEYPDVPVIIDEAYAELLLDGKRQHLSLFALAPPEMRKRIIVWRSATKALSAAGERMAVTICTDEKMSQLLSENINNIGHAPNISQRVYANVMSGLGSNDRKAIANYYREQVRLAERRLLAMGAAMPDAIPQEDSENPTELKPALHQVEGAFYVLANLEDLKGLELPPVAAAILGKSGEAEKAVIKTDQDVAFYLLCRGLKLVKVPLSENDKGSIIVSKNKKEKTIITGDGNEKGLMIAPLSYYGADPEACILRLTCSGGDGEVNEICNILEEVLTEARKIKRNVLDGQIEQMKGLLGPKAAATLDMPVSNATGSPPLKPIKPSPSKDLSKVVALSKGLEEKGPLPNERPEGESNKRKRQKQKAHTSGGSTPQNAQQLKEYIQNQEKYLSKGKVIVQKTQKIQAQQERMEEISEYIKAGHRERIRHEEEQKRALKEAKASPEANGVMDSQDLDLVIQGLSLDSRQKSAGIANKAVALEDATTSSQAGSLSDSQDLDLAIQDLGLGSRQKSATEIANEALSLEKFISMAERTIKRREKNKQHKISALAMHSLFGDWVRNKSTLPKRSIELTVTETPKERRDYEPWRNYLHSDEAQAKYLELQKLEQLKNQERDGRSLVTPSPFSKP